MPRRSARAARLVGWLLLAAAALANEWVIAAALSSDGVLEPVTRRAIRGGQLALAAGALVWLRWPALRRPLAVIAAALIVPWLLLETLLRTVDPLGQDYLDEVARLTALHEPDPRFGYRLPAGLDVELQGVRVRTNRAGMRWHDDPTADDGGAGRLLLLGDSVVFGWGVAQDHIAAAEIERALPDVAPGWRVDSAGMVSWNTRCEVEYLRALPEPAWPDHVALVITPNDADPRLEARASQPAEALRPFLDRPAPDRVAALIWQLATRSSRVVQAIARPRLLRAAADARASNFAPDGAAWADVEAALDDLVALADTRGFAVTPFLFAHPGARLAEIAGGRYGDALARRGLTLERLPLALYDRQHRNSVFDVHPDAEGHAILARGVIDTVAPRLTGAPRPNR